MLFLRNVVVRNVSVRGVQRALKLLPKDNNIAFIDIQDYTSSLWAIFMLDNVNRIMIDGWK